VPAATAMTADEEIVQIDVVLDVSVTVKPLDAE
jgi:hypothetical protein